ncbi:cytidine/deoxycytidylate deaminase family protein [Pleomassaria siparia CBS 279.74]|uniref:Cytidine/deoxycytidylate deaminase family protein n=1 Tax=Pleomassaria siparia CBS 279.74 TaxID=1314801 RepID=A0A6G1JT98_9PLEO|nr:cytidine/deoxycytidylate deaminase family protein [Pleomassaria siparia CBS 279.74]
MQCIHLPFLGYSPSITLQNARKRNRRAPLRQRPSTLVKSLLNTVEECIIPLTQQGVSSGSKLFGAAILSRKDLTPFTVATNNERVPPLLHGEITCIQQFFTVDFTNPATRPDPRKDCIFLATHEPCSLCLSGIAWSGFSELFYLFTYEDSRDLFSIPYDIEIIEQVFRVQGEEETDEQMKKKALYNRTNKFFTTKSLADVEIGRLKELYNGLNETYQMGKMIGTTSSSVWK